MLFSTIFTVASDELLVLKNADTHDIDFFFKYILPIWTIKIIFTFQMLSSKRKLMRGSYRSKTSINRHKTRKTRQNRKKEKRNNRGSNLLVLFYTFIPTNHANRFPEFNNYVRKK